MNPNRVLSALLLLALMMVIESKPMPFYWAPPPPPQPPLAPYPDPLENNHHDGPNQPPIDYEDYVVLSDDELVHDAQILQNLMMATKEEIEELVDDNPQLQTALLEKIKKVLHEKEAFQHDVIDHVVPVHLGPGPQPPPPHPPPHPPRHHHHHHHPKEVLLVDKKELFDQTTDKLINQPAEKITHKYTGIRHRLKDRYQDELYHLQHSGHHDDGDPLQASLDQAKVEMLRFKLKNNAAKLFKIGGNFKGKLLALKRQKMIEKKLRRQEEIEREHEAEEAAEAAVEEEEGGAEEGGHVRPKFHFNVSTGR